MRVGTVITEGGSMLSVYVENGVIYLEYPCDSHAPATRKLTGDEAIDLARILRSAEDILGAGR